MKISTCFFALFLVSPAVLAATSPWQSNPQGKVRLIAPYTTAPQETPLYVGIDFQPEPGWVVYWKIPGDAGLAPRFNFKGSRGITDPVVLWPRPKLFLLPGNIREYGYDEEVVYPVRAKRTLGAIHIVADVYYLICKESCVPHRSTLTLDLPPGAGPAPDPAMEALLQRYLSQIPRENDADVIASLHPVGGASRGLGLILLLGFLGGLLLNIMPCVLPVLSIKLFGLLRHSGEEQRVIVRDAFASAAGIVFSFIAGAGILVVAKEVGRAVGWGVQFQNPAFVAFLAAITALFGMNLWGFYEINLPPALARWGTFHSDDDGPVSFFVSGMFATLLATPCSAPFLGTAMGFALSQSPSGILGIFLAAGLGMATPYLVLAAFPGTLYWLPKPGAWMVRVKYFLGFLLFGTALWLGWVFVHQVGWVRPAMETTGPIAWEPFQEDKIQTLVDSGKSVFVDVSAEWCLTCKVNETLVFRDAEVVNEFKRQGIVMMHADWTNQNAVIGAYLKKNGRAGIPFYALYRPGKPPVLLSEFLTKSKVLEALKN